MWDDEEDGENEDSNKSAITIRIATGVRVSGDDNLVCLPNGAAKDHNTNNGQSSSSSAAADHARSIAEAVTAAIRQGGEQEVGGIPMIDEEGRPRGIRVQVEAGIEVHGKRNVLVGGGGGGGGEEGEEYDVLGALVDRLVKNKRRRTGKKKESRKRRREDHEEGKEEESEVERRPRRRRRVAESRPMDPRDRRASV